MSAFWIFAVAVTTAYVVYYTVMICIDLYRKPKDQTHDNVETFEIDSTPSEESKLVEEMDGGFRVANSDDGGWNETNIRPATQESKPEDSNSGPKIDATGAVITPAQEKINTASNDMEEIDTKMTGELADITFKYALSSGNPPVEFERPKQDNHAEKTDENVPQVRDKI